jgi:hypothetical protein
LRGSQLDDEHLTMSIYGWGGAFVSEGGLVVTILRQGFLEIRTFEAKWRLWAGTTAVEPLEIGARTWNWFWRQCAGWRQIGSLDSEVAWRPGRNRATNW